MDTIGASEAHRRFSALLQPLLQGQPVVGARDWTRDALDTDVLTYAGDAGDTRRCETACRLIPALEGCGCLGGDGLRCFAWPADLGCADPVGCRTGRVPLSAD